MDLKTQINPNTLLSPIDKSSNQKISKETLELNDTIDEMNLTDVLRVFLPAMAQYTFFPAAHETSSKIDHIVGHKTRLNKYKKIETTPCILYDHDVIKLEFNNKRNSRKSSNT
jgi:exonuclease III